MNEFLKKYQFKIKGDIAILIVAILLVLISFAVVFSTSSNLVNIYGRHTHYYYFLKHLILIGIAAFLFFFGMQISAEKFKKYAYVLMILSIMLLIYTMFFGIAANGETARRWIRVPSIGTIQPSFVAMYVMMIFTAVFLDKIKNKKTTFFEDLKNYWGWILLSIAFIMPANNSTALMILLLTFIVLVVGGYSFKKLFGIVMILFSLLAFYYLAAKAFPDQIPNRFNTLENRIKRFIQKEDEKKLELTQTVRAKMAIASGGFFRWAPGKSVQKNMLSQSSSDFVYAIVIEEYGLIGGVLILLFYSFLFLRIFIISQHLKQYFDKILVISLGLPIIIQAFVNMSVATGLFPVTGQPLPLISTGGTTILLTGLVLGIIVKLSEKIYEE